MELFLLPVLSLLSVFSSFLLLILHVSYSSSSNNTERITNYGASRSYPLIGNMLDFIKNRNRFFDWTTELLLSSPTNTTVFRRPGIPPTVMTANPSNVEHIVRTNFSVYPKGESFTSVLRDVFGDMLFTFDGDLWKDNRRNTAQQLNSNMVRSATLDATMEETRSRLIPILERASKTDRTMDLQDIFERFMFDGICKVAFDLDPGLLSDVGIESSAATFFESFKDLKCIAIRFYHVLPSMWKVMKLLNIGYERRLKRSMLIIHEYLEKIVIRPKLAHTRETSKDILSWFIKHDDDSMKYLRDVCVGLVVAGKDTASTGLTWLFWLLSSNPIVEKTILEELEAIRARHNKTIGDPYSFEELREMHYLQAAITESMRLYPPATIIRRTSDADNVLPDGTPVKKGWSVMYNAYAMGRMEKIWGKDCLEYRPERWLKDGVFLHESPFRYPIFHAGPRICPGKELGYIQMKYVAASVMERFAVEVQDEGKCPSYTPINLTFKMKGGLPVKVRAREVRN